MNKNIKQALYAISILLFAPAYGMLDIVKETASKGPENIHVYAAGVTAIDATAYSASNFATWLAHAGHKKEDVARRKDLFGKMTDSRRARIEQNIRQDEKNAINEIYQEFNVSPEQQQTIEAGTNQFKQFEKEYMSQPHKETNNGVTISGPLMPALYEKCGIHPDGVKKVISPEPAIENKAWDASAGCLQADITINNGVLTINKVVNPPTATFYPRFFELSQVMQDATIAHEFGHLAAQHGATAIGLKIGIPAFTGADQKTITQSDSFKKLATISERQAEILYKNKDWAEIMRKNRSMGYYPEHLFLGHYAQLAEIDELHKLKDKIKNYKPIPIRAVLNPKAKECSFNPTRFSQSLQKLQAVSTNIQQLETE